MASGEEGEGGFFSNLKEKYEELMSSMEEKGIPSPRVLLPALILIIVLGAAYLLMPGITSKTKELTLTVRNVQGSALPAMEVSLYDGEKALGTQETDEDGKVTFAKVPEKSSSLRVVITDPNEVYTRVEKSVDFNTGSITLSSVDEPGTQPMLFTVYVVDSDQSYLSSARVSIVTDAGDEQEHATDYQGMASFELEGTVDHLTLKASLRGYKDEQRSVSKSQLALGSLRVELRSDGEIDDGGKGGNDDPDDPKYGKVQVLLTSETMDRLDGITVLLRDSTTYRSLKTELTDGSGIALFEDVPLGGEYYVEARESAKYLAASGDTFILRSASEVMEAPLMLTEKREGDYIDLEISSKSGTVADAEITLFDTLGRQLQYESSNSEGKANFLVTKGREYYIAIYAEGFIPASLMATAAPKPKKVELDELTEENSATLKISVISDEGSLERAEVVLYKSDGFFLGLPSGYTDSEGIVEFTIPREIDGESYKLFAKASKDEMRGESARVQSDSAEALQIMMVPNPGMLEIKLKDALSKNATIKAGSVSIISAAGETLGSCEITFGNCTVEVPSNIEFTIVAISNGYLQTTSDALTLAPSEIRKVDLSLVSEKDAKGVAVSFIGAFNSQGEALELGNAESYTLKFLATYPSASDVAGFHMHISAPGDFIHIEDIDSTHQSLYTAVRNSEDCYSSSGNGSSTTAGKIGAFDVLFPKGATGSRQIAVKVSIDPDAPASSSFALNFKAYSMKAGVLLSAPSVENLRIAENAAPLDVVKKMCGQKNTIKQLQITSSPLLCDSNGNFCRKIVIDKKEIPLGSEFSIAYEVLSKEQIDSITVKSGNIRLADSAPTDSGEGTLPVSILPNSRASGTMRLLAFKAGATDLVIGFNSEKRSNKFHNSLRVVGNNVLSVAVSPLEMLAGEEKRIRVKVIGVDDMPVTDASVTLYDCERAPLSAEEVQVQGSNERGEGYDGVYLLRANPLTTGKMGVRVSHTDYSTYDECLVSVKVNEESLTISPSSLRFEGDSQKSKLQRVTVSTEMDVRSFLSILHNCGNQQSPVLHAFPDSFANFRDSETIEIDIFPNITVTQSCNIIFQQRFSQQEYISKSIPVRIDLQGPSIIDPSVDPSIPPIPTEIVGPVGPPLPGTVTLELDELGFDDKFFDTSSLGEVSSCILQGAPADFRVTADCTADTLRLSADYSGAAIDNTYRAKARLEIRSGVGARKVKFLTIVVTAPNAKPPVKVAQPNYYPDLPPIPNPIIIELDPFTRRSELIYSLGALGEPAMSCAISGFDFSGVTTQFCGPLEQRIKVIADFTGQTTYDRLVQRIYRNNPMCMDYYSQQGLMGQMGGYGNQLYGGQFDLTSNLNANYRYQNSQLGMYGGLNYNYQYGSYPYNQMPGGYYPMGQYSQGIGYYPGYPEMQQSFLYPPQQSQYSNLQNPMGLSYAYGNNYDPRYSGINCDSEFIEGSLLVVLKSGSKQTIPVRIIARGGSPFPRQMQPFYPMIRQPFSPQQNGILSGQAVELDPFTLQRYVHFEVQSSAGAYSGGITSCSAESDSAYFGQVRSTLNYNPAFQQRDYFYPTNQFNPLNQPSSSGKFKNAISALSCDTSSNGVAIKFLADAGKASIGKADPGQALNSEDSLYLRMMYPSGVIHLAPVQLFLGGEEYALEPLSKNLQFVLTTSNPSIGGESGAFKHTSDILSRDTCTISGIKGAEGATSDLGGFRGKVDITADFASEKASLQTDPATGIPRMVPLDPNDKSPVSIPIPLQGTLKCDAEKGSVSSTINVASFLSQYGYNILDNLFGQEVEITLPMTGKVANSDSSVLFKKYNKCVLSSADFDSQFRKLVNGMDEKEKAGVYSCTFDEDGIKIRIDYKQAFASMPSGERPDQLHNNFAIELFSVTEYLKSGLKQKITERPLASIKLKMDTQGLEERSGFTSRIELHTQILDGSEALFPSSIDKLVDSKAPLLVRKGMDLRFGAKFPDGDVKDKRAMFVVKVASMDEAKRITETMCKYGCKASAIREKLKEVIVEDVVPNDGIFKRVGEELYAYGFDTDDAGLSGKGGVAIFVITEDLSGKEIMQAVGVQILDMSPAELDPAVDANMKKYSPYAEYSKISGDEGNWLVKSPLATAKYANEGMVLAKYVKGQVPATPGTPGQPSMPGGQPSQPVQPGVAPSTFGFFPLKERARITDGFYCTEGRDSEHTGVDFGVGLDTDVFAVDDGVVADVGYGEEAGNRVVIDHGKGCQSVYYHLNKALVAEGEKVSGGKLIAKSGESGKRKTGPHLHFSYQCTQSNGKLAAINPCLMLGYPMDLPCTCDPAGKKIQLDSTQVFAQPSAPQTSVGEDPVKLDKWQVAYCKVRPVFTNVGKYNMPELEFEIKLSDPQSAGIKDSEIGNIQIKTFKYAPDKGLKEESTFWIGELDAVRNNEPFKDREGAFSGWSFGDLDNYDIRVILIKNGKEMYGTLEESGFKHCEGSKTFTADGAGQTSSAPSGTQTNSQSASTPLDISKGEIIFDNVEIVQKSWFEAVDFSGTTSPLQLGIYQKGDYFEVPLHSPSIYSSEGDTKDEDDIFAYLDEIEDIRLELGGKTYVDSGDPTEFADVAEDAAQGTERTQYVGKNSIRQLGANEGCFKLEFIKSRVVYGKTERFANYDNQIYVQFRINKC